MRFALVINPTSGRRKGAAIGAEATALLKAAGHEVISLQGENASDARDQLKQAIDRGLDSVVVVGGDGALHAVLDRIADSDLTFGLIPAGTGNDTARTLGIPRKDAKAAVDILLKAKTRTIDLALAGEAFVATVVASGFDSKVNERANAMTWPRGNMRYNIAILAELKVFEPLHFSIDLDGERIERDAMLVAVGNGPSFGGGLRMCEGAVLDDGYLDVVIINPLSKIELLKVFPKLSKGTHVSHSCYEHHLAKKVTIDSPGIVAYGDGERLGALPITISACPGLLRVFVP
ncbi:MAG: YegS/Rv2252/BmrU family lipid kinase [Kineosporiaceae bacterium]|nr:YegS/Rv2252/BmrU family lipid kinase [Aeromicrobium sp.]